MFSLVLTTFRGFDKIEPLFKVSDSETEIIIIDSNYNEDTKEKIQEFKHDYYKATYAPPRGKSIYYKDFCQCLNTGLAYAENEWLIKLDDRTELKPDFYPVLRKTISSAVKRFNKDFAIEILKIEECEDPSYKKWNYPFIDAIGDQGYDVFILDREGLRNGIFALLPQFVMHVTAFDKLNGFDERYDVGCGHDDNDLFQRAITAGIKVLLNKNLMTFKYAHNKNQSPIDLTRTLFKIELEEIKNGRYKAYNRFEMKDLREKMLKQKHKYVIS